MDLRKKIRGFPDTCGVYIMKSKQGKVLYVGKAISLRKRVGSYFNRPDVKTSALLEKVVGIEYIECSSEEQALILEAYLIKEKKPKYNIALRDDKSYPYVEISREEFPRIYISHQREKTSGVLLGPYPKVKIIKSALNLIRRVFPYRSCLNLPKEACLYFHIGLCPAPCVGKISEAKYRENVKNICRVLAGDRKRIEKHLERSMNKLALNNRFEEAALVRDTLISLKNLYEGNPQKHKLIELKEKLNLLYLPLIIEAIDISCLKGTFPTGSLVRFKDALPDKNNYRRFSIKGVKGMDDYAMIKEVVKRRYLRLLKENKELPDLIIIDGGLGQVQKAKEVLDSLGISSAVIGISKRNEEVWFPKANEPLILPKDSSGLHLIQEIRDESHRFAHKYHLNRRKRGMI